MPFSARTLSPQMRTFSAITAGPGPAATMGPLGLEVGDECPQPSWELAKARGPHSFSFVQQLLQGWPCTGGVFGGGQNCRY